MHEPARAHHFQARPLYAGEGRPARDSSLPLLVARPVIPRGIALSFDACLEVSVCCRQQEETAVPFGASFFLPCDCRQIPNRQV